ncbi:monoacylglycerol/Diacylglycerol O-acyltransferase [Anolis carolinensis]|uniref:Phospholipid/glycerol acyltransferase domain-containing protein n=1 Tax=Anolis carolinensis TaxID=28377 RepID=R4GAK9_ANOCA|nr:PREDICTED: transmembrane protein 68 [Anolis carolinensis]|eukprot:XP_008114388.2 PREDICTED: transmembrane protein 68 [Anolis carolinensis]
MTAENPTLGQESNTWLVSLLGGQLNFMMYPLIMLTILIILYYPIIFIFSFNYMSSAFYFIYSKIGNLPEDGNSKLWDKPKRILAIVSGVLGKILHGYEICGIENLPKGPAVLVYYHGAATVDYYFFVFEIYRITGRFCYSVIAHALMHLPGVKQYLRVNRCSDFTREECVALLKQGHLLGIAPGGLREQNYGDNTYKLLWGERKGFAHVAIVAKVPIIPIFTQNIREGYRTYGNTWLTRWLYERTWAGFPLYGLIPVKLRTHIGQPIPYDPNVTAEELAEKTKMAVEALRDKYQTIPGSILRALWERFEVHHKNK